MALACEGWLDLLVFVWLASAFLLPTLWHHRRTDYFRRLAFCAGFLTVLEDEGLPVVRLSPGAHKVDGRFTWDRMPDSSDSR